MRKELRYCDKCGEEIKPTFGYREYRIETIDFGPAGQYDMRRYELCRNCFIDLQRFVDPNLVKSKEDAGYYNTRKEEATE